MPEEPRKKKGSMKDHGPKLDMFSNNYSKIQVVLKEKTIKIKV